MIHIIKKTLEGRHHSWHEILKSTLWVDRITPKRSTAMSPYMLVYGKESRLPILVEFLTLDFMHQLDKIDEEPMRVRLAQLDELKEKRRDYLQIIENHQVQMKRTFDKKASPKIFQLGDIVLKLDDLKSRPRKHTKFYAMWAGSYIIMATTPHNSFHLSTLEGKELGMPVNGIHLKQCF